MAHDRGKRAQDAKDGAMLRRIRHEGGDEIDDGAPREARDRESLDVERGPGRVDGFDDCREEDGVGEELDIGWEIHQAKGPDFPIFEGGEDVGALQGLGRGC